MNDKQNVVYTNNEILFSFKKEGNSDTYYNTTWMSEMSQSQKDKYIMIPLI